MINNTIKTTTKKISCNGGFFNQLGHPLVYLKINNHSHKVKCPYCSTVFVYDNSSQSKLCQN